MSSDERRGFQQLPDRGGSGVVCPCVGCGTPGELSIAADLRVRQFNQWLRAWGDKPLNTGEVYRCPGCRELEIGRNAEEMSKRVHRARDFIRNLKAGESELMARTWLIQHGYADTVKAIEDGKRSKGSRRKA